MEQQPIIVLPTYNEVDNLETALTKIFGALPQTHVLVVDDNSPDGTGRLADEISTRDERVHVLHRTEKAGLGRAYLAGFEWCLARAYTHVFEMDADLSHPAEKLPELLAASQHADIVLGSRWVDGGGAKGWPFKRRLLSKGGSLYARTVLGVDVRDLTGGFKCFTRHALQTMDLESVQTVGYGFQIELTWRALQRGLKVVEVPIVFVDRVAGQSKMSGSIFREALLLVWKLRLGR